MIYQIVISKLKDVSDKNEFLDLTRKMVKWLETQKGFISYKLYTESESFSDSLVFENKDAAQKINKAFLQTPVCRRMLELVDADYRGFLGEEVPLS
jgi:quinol monooxygenase YgiN